MTRSEALAPLKAGEGRLPARAGLFMRGELRKAAIRNLVDFYEEKSLFSSEFIFRGDANRIIAFRNALTKA